MRPPEIIAHSPSSGRSTATAALGGARAGARETARKTLKDRTARLRTATSTPSVVKLALVSEEEMRTSISGCPLAPR